MANDIFKLPFYFLWHAWQTIYVMMELSAFIEHQAHSSLSAGVLILWWCGNILLIMKVEQKFARLRPVQFDY